MSSDLELKRQFVSDMYGSDRWKNRVKHMRENQIIAIYIREQARIAEGLKKKKPPDEDQDIPF